MSKRAAAAAETRRKIVAATRALHGERGIAATRWEDIAARAGVGVGTVYRHFPSLDELIPACGEVSMEVIALPDPAQTQARFAGLKSPAERIEGLVREAFAIYERGAPELHVIRREANAHPQVAEGQAALDASLDALIAAALSPSSTPRRERALARALIDLDTWQALRDQGLTQDEAVAEIAALLTARLLR